MYSKTLAGHQLGFLAPFHTEHFHVCILNVLSVNKCIYMQIYIIRISIYDIFQGFIKILIWSWPDSQNRLKKKNQVSDLLSGSHTISRAIFKKRFYLPFPTAADDPFTVTGGSDGCHADPVGIVNDVHQPACLGGEGSDFPVIPCWQERKTKTGKINTSHSHC